jgi:trypsin
VATPFDLSVASAQPVNLPAPTSEFDPPAGTIITVSGWGTTSVRIEKTQFVLIMIDNYLTKCVDIVQYTGRGKHL